MSGVDEGLDEGLAGSTAPNGETGESLFPQGPSEAVSGPAGGASRLDGRGCGSCGRPLTGRQRGACSARCRARLSRERRAAAETRRRATAGPWRFRVQPAGRRFGWRGVVYASDRRTGLLEVHDPEFASALRGRTTRDQVEEIIHSTLVTTIALAGIPLGP